MRSFLLGLVILLCGLSGAAAQPTTKVFKAYTSTADSANSGGSVAVSFFADGEWGETQVISSGASKGQVLSSTVDLPASWPSKLNFTFADGSTDAWNFWKVELGCWTLMEDPSGHWKHWPSETCMGMTTVTCNGGNETVCGLPKPAPKVSYDVCKRGDVPRWGAYRKGCIAWLIILIITVASAYYFNPLPTDDETLAPILTFMAVICMWLMWTITFCMQINPLLQPILAAE